MNETITISLPEEVASELEAATREEGLSQSELIKKALDGYLFLRKSRRLRERGKSDLQNQMTDHVPELAALFSKTQALPQARALSEDEIAAEIAAYRGGQ